MSAQRTVPRPARARPWAGRDCEVLTVPARLRLYGLIRHVRLDHRAAAGVCLEEADGPDRVSGRRDCAEDLVTGTRVGSRDLVPATHGVLRDHGQLVTARPVVRGTDDPRRPVTDADASDVGEPGSHAAEEVLDQRTGLVGSVIALAGCPNLAATDRNGLQQAVGQAGGGDIDHRPVLAVPVFD